MVAGASHYGNSPPLSPHKAQVLQAEQEGLGRTSSQGRSAGKRRWRCQWQLAMSLGAIRANSEVRINELLRDLVGVQAELLLLPQHAFLPSDPRSLVTISANALQITLVFDTSLIDSKSEDAPSSPSSSLPAASLWADSSFAFSPSSTSPSPSPRS